MLKFILTHGQFLDKGIRVSLRNICFGGFYGCFFAQFIEALGTFTFGLAEVSLREALTVELEALGSVTMALVWQWHRFECQ